MKDFNNKNVYITGGSSGIGLSSAKLLAARGAHVMIFARTRGRLEGAVEEIHKQRGSPDQRFSFMQMDVSKNGEVMQGMTKAIEEFGVPDVLINCAGRAYPHHFEDISYEQFDETMKINLYGAWNTVMALVPHMKQHGGHIVNVASVAGFVGVFGYTDYAASKFAIVGFSEALRSELKRYQIQVSVLCPSDTDTPGFQTENVTKPEETKAISAAAKVIHPDDVATALLKGMRKGKFMIIPNMEGRFTYIAKRLVSSLVEFIMDRDIRKVQKAQS